jgi:hypothetical protein
MLPAVSFFEGFQTPAGSRETRARSSGRHLKPITNPDIELFFENASYWEISRRPAHTSVGCAARTGYFFISL